MGKLYIASLMAGSFVLLRLSLAPSSLYLILIFAKGTQLISGTHSFRSDFQKQNNGRMLI